MPIPFPLRLCVCACTALPLAFFVTGCEDDENKPVPQCAPSNAFKSAVNFAVVDRRDTGCLCDQAKALYDNAAPSNQNLTTDWAAWDEIKFRDWPMISSHDAGTGYHKAGDVCSATNQINNHAVCQTGTFKDQLHCGARAFDTRVSINENDNTKTCFFHGDVEYCRTDMSEVLSGMAEWMNENPDELILLSIREKNEAAMTLLNQKLAAAKIPAVIGGVGWHQWLTNATVGAVKEHARSLGGKGIIAVNQYRFEWTDAASKDKTYGYNENYDNSIVCHNAAASCYDDNAVTLRKNFWEYVDRVANKGSRSTRWQIQAHWQYTAEAITLAKGDPAMGSKACILNDEKATCINLNLAARIRQGAYKHGLNLVSVDHVCHNGNELYTALIEYINSERFDNFRT